MHKKLENCICCGVRDLFVVLDLNTQPPANSFHSVDEQIQDYELKLMGCSNCWHTQLSIAVDPAELFKHYLYVSGTSQTLKDYFEWFAKQYDTVNQDSHAPRVLDIACNDGSQLDSFKRRGWRTWGVDPAENLVPLAQAKGHTVVCDFWNKTVAKQLPKFHLITAQNVFAHTAEIDEFLQACKLVMQQDTKLVIQTSQAYMFDRNEFDTIYHEHISFFSTSSMEAVCERNGLHLNSVSISDIHGSSYVFEIGLSDNPDETVNEFLTNESHRYVREFYNQYGANATACLLDLKQFVEQQKSLDKTVIGYGAAAKGMTVLNAGQILLDYIVDDNPLKQGLLTPGMNIPVVSKEHLLEEPDNIVVIPLAWNFYDEICGRVKDLRPLHKDLFVRYFPSLDAVNI
jgi:predicted TPR repeat methyltransferase